MEIGTIEIILGLCLAISEALALIPAVKSNSLFQVIWRIVKLGAGESKPGIG